MQGKGIIKFFLVVMAVVCLFQFALILPTSKVEKKAEQIGQLASQGVTDINEAYVIEKEARVGYLDSMSNEKIFSIPLFKDYTYQDLKSQQLALGLDLKGGLSTLLQVDLEEVLKSLAKGSKDPTFLSALEEAKRGQLNSQSDFITLFGQAWKKSSEGKTLNSLFASNEALQEDINFESTDNEVLAVLRAKADETVELTYKRLKDRIDGFGVTQPNVTLDQARDLILVELPGVDNPERVRSFLQSQAKLEFWNVLRYNEGNIINKIIDYDERLKRQETDSVATEPDSIMVAVVDSLGNETGDSTLEAAAVDPRSELGPLLENLGLNVDGSFGNAAIGLAQGNKRSSINKYLETEEFERVFKNVKFLWAADPIKNPTTGEIFDQYFLYAIKLEPGKGDQALLTGDHVVSASAQPDPLTSEVMVSLRMDNTGSRIWADMTTKAANADNKEIAIVLDDRVVSAPSVNQPITGGNSSITGNFSIQEGRDLANILQVGKLPTKTKIIQESLVGPSLGKDNIRKSILSLVIGFLAVIGFMVFYYAGGGIISVISLLLNIFFVFGALSSFGTVLTLPGIAGILLTIGMAVDANVIIFERIREELRSGKAVGNAVVNGFKQSYSAILDANVTTLIVAFVLAYFGIGPIKGFAVVLIIGVIFSLFTAVLVSRLLIEWWLDRGKEMSFWTKASESLFSNINVDWLGMRKKSYILSGVLLLVSLISIFTRGFDLSVDFKGGYSFNVEFDASEEISSDQIRTAMTDVFGSTPVVKAVDVQNTYNVVTDYLVDDLSDDAADRVIAALHQGVNQITSQDVDFELFKRADATGTHVISSSKVGPTIADDIASSSRIAGILALALIFLYIFIRFSKWQFSLGAVAALAHDSVIILGLFSLLHGILPFALELDQNFIAALLTVIGYSINDTIIVFDRIREMINTYLKKGKKELYNMAINATVSRTVITSMTTFFVVLVLFVFGGSSIKGFAFALLMGIIVGTYSSIFIGTPIVYDLTDDDPHKETKKTSSPRPAKQPA